MRTLSALIAAGWSLGCASAAPLRPDAPPGFATARAREAAREEAAVPSAPSSGGAFSVAPPQIREPEPPGNDLLLAGSVLLGVSGLLLGMYAADPYAIRGTEGPEVAPVHEGRGVLLFPAPDVAGWRRRAAGDAEEPASPLLRALPLERPPMR